MEHKCAFCNNTLKVSAYNNAYYHCTNKNGCLKYINDFCVEYNIPIETNKILYFYFIYKIDKAYRIEYRMEDKNYLIIRNNIHKISQEIIRVHLSKKDTYLITPDNCKEKLSYYLTFS